MSAVTLSRPNLTVAANVSRPYVSCRACRWMAWAVEGDSIEDLVEAAEAHLAEAHPPLRWIADGADDVALEPLVATLEEVLTPRCCHITGEHDPTHYRRQKHLCGFQRSEGWHRALLALGLRHLDTAAVATSHDVCCHCGTGPGSSS